MPIGKLVNTVLRQMYVEYISARDAYVAASGPIHDIDRLLNAAVEAQVVLLCAAVEFSDDVHSPDELLTAITQSC